MAENGWLWSRRILYVVTLTPLATCKGMLNTFRHILNRFNSNKRTVLSLHWMRPRKNTEQFAHRSNDGDAITRSCISHARRSVVIADVVEYQGHSCCENMNK